MIESPPQSESTTATKQPVDKSGVRVRRMFGEISGRYDFLNHFLSGGIDYYWRWRTVRAVAPEGDAPILDVCTGTGDLAIAYAKRSRGPVIGTDFTPEMLRIADRKGERLDNLKGFVEADTMALPFGDDCFQIVSVAFGLRNVADTRAGLREMLRVCRPGGRVAVLEFSMPRTPVFGSLYRWYFRNVLPRIGQLLARNRESAYEYLPASVGEFPDGAELGAIMESCGMTDVTWTPLTFGIATLYVGRKPESTTDETN